MNRLLPRRFTWIWLWLMVVFTILWTFALAVPSSFAEQRLKVVTTFTIIADIARNVAGDAAVVQSITKPGAEIHDYQPTPRDIVRTRDADLILVSPP